MARGDTIKEIITLKEGRLLRYLWWRRRESNPGPKKVSLGFYMLILSFKSNGKITDRQVFSP